MIRDASSSPLPPPPPPQTIPSPSPSRWLSSAGRPTDRGNGAAEAAAAAAECIDCFQGRERDSPTCVHGI